jgi:hypothetical protein
MSAYTLPDLPYDYSALGLEKTLAFNLPGHVLQSI